MVALVASSHCLVSAAHPSSPSLYGMNQIRFVRSDSSCTKMPSSELPGHPGRFHTCNDVNGYGNAQYVICTTCTTKRTITDITTTSQHELSGSLARGCLTAHAGFHTGIKHCQTDPQTGSLGVNAPEGTRRLPSARPRTPPRCCTPRPCAAGPPCTPAACPASRRPTSR